MGTRKNRWAIILPVNYFNLFIVYYLLAAVTDIRNLIVRFTSYSGFSDTNSNIQTLSIQTYVFLAIYVVILTLSVVMIIFVFWKSLHKILLLYPIVSLSYPILWRIIIYLAFRNHSESEALAIIDNLSNFDVTFYFLGVAISVGILLNLVLYNPYIKKWFGQLR